MATAPRPDRETLLALVSAFFDGELLAEEERVLFAAMAEDPEIEAEFLAMERLLAGSADLSGLPDAVMAVVAPAAVADAGLLLSAHVDLELRDGELGDGGLGDGGRARLASLLASDDGMAREAFALAAVAESASLVVEASASSAATLRAVAGLGAAVAARVADEERAERLLCARCDDEVTAAELEELRSLVARGARPGLAPQHVGEAVAVALAALVADPAAARAGAAALQVIEAERLRAAAIAAAPSPTTRAEPGALERLRAAFAGLFAPLAFAGAAAFAFVILKGDPTKPPAHWLEEFDLGEELLSAATEPGVLDVLADNSDTEVQAIDSGSHMAAVFSTEATSITVIWVPEPEGGEGVIEESGT